MSSNPFHKAAARRRAFVAATVLACAAGLSLLALAQGEDVPAAPQPAASASALAPASAATPANASPTPAAGRSDDPPAADTVRIAVPGHGPLGGDAQMVAQVFRPAGPGPFPVVLFSHGRAPDASHRASLVQGISREQLRFWLSRGDAVLAPIRPGYGSTGGADRENSGARFDALGACRSRPDFASVAAAAADTVDAALAWLRTQPWADAHHVLLVGQSVGGMTTVAAAARHPEGVVGYINFAGGAGGNPERAPGHSCDPAQLGRLYAEFGQTTTLRSLWVYAQNDQYWGADVPPAWHAAFARGGSPTVFVHAPPVADGNGHGLSSHARRLWAADVEAFLAEVDFPAANGAAPHR